jgi:hypothetical protein
MSNNTKWKFLAFAAIGYLILAINGIYSGTLKYKRKPTINYTEDPTGYIIVSVLFIAAFVLFTSMSIYYYLKSHDKNNS